jgi:hypothetical protein
MQHKKLLQTLKRGSVTNITLNKICFRYGARLHELRQEGLVFLVQYLDRGVYLYTATKIPKKLLEKYGLTKNGEGV